MTYVKINDTLYPAEISGKLEDRDWDKRESKAITLEMPHATAEELFVDGCTWSIVDEGEVADPETGNPITQTEEYDNRDFTVAGDITDHRDGTVTVKMGKYTTEEMLLMEVLK